MDMEGNLFGWCVAGALHRAENDKMVGHLQAKRVEAKLAPCRDGWDFSEMEESAVFCSGFMAGRD